MWSINEKQMIQTCPLINNAHTSSAGLQPTTCPLLYLPRAKPQPRQRETPHHTPTFHSLIIYLNLQTPTSPHHRQISISSSFSSISNRSHLVRPKRGNLSEILDRIFFFWVVALFWVTLFYSGEDEL